MKQCSTNLSATLKHVFVLSVLLTGFSQLCEAKIWRVNKNPGVTADFTSAQAAHDAATAGDTIYIEPLFDPNAFYGDLAISKKLVLLGAGYYLSENGLANTNGLYSRIANLSLNPAKDLGGNNLGLTTGASGSVIKGISADVCGTITIGVNNVTLDRNLFANFNCGGPAFNISDNVMNVTLTRNFINKGSFNIGANVSNVLISNNYLNNPGMPMSSSCTFLNNIIKGNFTAYNSTISNNILLDFGAVFTNTGCTISNNICKGTQFGTTNGNQSSVDVDNNVFVGGASPDAKYKLKSGSPATGTGTPAGTDIGMFGGSLAYIVSGIPDIPTIYNFVMPGTATTVSGLQVTIGAKTNK